MSRLRESLLETIDELQDLPTRTLNRRVGCIFTTGSAPDKRLAEKIMSVALGVRTEWKHGEVRALERKLELERDSLHDWLVLNTPV